MPLESFSFGHYGTWYMHLLACCTPTVADHLNSPFSVSSSTVILASYLHHCTIYCRLNKSWWGPVYILSTVLTVDWVLLGSGESIKG